MPTSHAVHNEEEVPLYVPAPHAVQLTDLSAAYFPPSQLVHVVAPAEVSVWNPAAQSRHASVSAEGAYVP